MFFTHNDENEKLRRELKFSRELSDDFKKLYSEICDRFHASQVEIEELKFKNQVFYKKDFLKICFEHQKYFNEIISLNSELDKIKMKKNIEINNKLAIELIYSVSRKAQINDYISKESLTEYAENIAEAMKAGLTKLNEIKL